MHGFAEDHNYAQAYHNLTCGNSVSYGAYFGGIFNFDRHRTSELRDVGLLHVNESHVLLVHMRYVCYVVV